MSQSESFGLTDSRGHGLPAIINLKRGSFCQDSWWAGHGLGKAAVFSVELKTMVSSVVRLALFSCGWWIPVDGSFFSIFILHFC